MRKIELLAPAKNAEIGIEAIRHGADAVYIGAEQFGARQAAGNSLDDIARLVQFAHTFRAKVFVTLNTILTDQQVHEAEQLVRQLHDIGVDALIVQDMAIVQSSLHGVLAQVGMPLHASTQMDNRTPEKVRFLHGLGIEQVVLARELSLADIRSIHEACPDVALEAFVHGALCVSYSGQCYASEACFRRSANRGECAQVCRMEFDLHDADGEIIQQHRHFLSLKDLCQIDRLQELLDAGVSSLKIEGRLKDLSYVKNVTAAYSEALNRVVEQHPDRYERSSSGRVELRFVPDVRKSFNRGFTHYFLDGKNDDIWSFDTPKALGEEVGTVRDVFDRFFTVTHLSSSQLLAFANGDGLCYIDRRGALHGFRLNRVDGDKLYPLDMPDNMRRGTRIYRNYDKDFEQRLSRESAERYIPVDIFIEETPDGFKVGMTDSDGFHACSEFTCEHQLARTHQSDNVRRQLSRLGGSPFRMQSVDIRYRKNWFIPSSHLAEWRRQVAEKLESERKSYLPKRVSHLKAEGQTRSDTYNHQSLSYLANVANSQARAFYDQCGATTIDWAYEHTHPSGVPLMFCRHCIRYSMGWCSRQGKSVPYPLPLYLVLKNGIRFRLEFDCKQCMMKLYKDEK